MKYKSNNFTVLFLFSLLSMSFLISCDKKNKGEWVVAEVSKDTLLTAETKVQYPSTLILQISGQVDDSIEVHSMRLAGGKIQKEFRVDHYYPEISVQFKSYKAKKGSIKIKYYLP